MQDGATPVDGLVELPHFAFDGGAQEIFVEWATELHTKLISGEQNPLMRQHLGKFEKLFCIAALILHLADGFTARDVARKQWAGVTTTMQAESALAILEDHGRIVGVESVPADGGRPTTGFYVNPNVWRPS